MITLQIEGLKELQATLKGFSERRLNAAVATGLTRTGVQVREEMKATMRRVFDRPTPYTINSMKSESATASKLSTKVFIRDKATGREPVPTKVLAPQVEGGGRGSKPLEVALRAAGVLPGGWKAVPGSGARRDAYGNMTRGQVSALLAQVRRVSVFGPKDAKTLVKLAVRTGGVYVAVKPGGKLAPGVYQRDTFGRKLTPVLVFVRNVNYSKRLDFYGVAKRVVQDRLAVEVGRAIGEQLSKVASSAQ